LVVISSAVFAALAIGAMTVKDVSFRLSQLSMTYTAGAFVPNAASRAHTRAACAQNATSGTVSAVTGYIAPAQTVASRFSHHDETFSIVHGLADCAHATLLSLRKKVRNARFRGALATGGVVLWAGCQRRFEFHLRLQHTVPVVRRKALLDIIFMLRLS
jgi:hypothetical protein